MSTSFTLCVLILHTARPVTPHSTQKPLHLCNSEEFTLFNGIKLKISFQEAGLFKHWEWWCFLNYMPIKNAFILKPSCYCESNDHNKRTLGTVLPHSK